MNNAILFYYNLKPDKIIRNNNMYYFYIKNVLYHFVIYDRNIKEIDAIYRLNNYMSMGGFPVHKIILNKDNKMVTFIDNIPYILYRVRINTGRLITLKDINNFSMLSYNNKKEIIHDNWDLLWASRVDYLEYHINQNGKKYPLLVDSFSYFVGMCENAISYVRNTYNEEKKDYSDSPRICHQKLIYNDSMYSLYNPLNIVIDHKSRDLAEYIKLSFFNDNFNIYDELNQHFRNNYYSKFGIRLLFGRILYPNFYFDLYDQVILGLISEDKLSNVINRINDYEDYLRNIYIYLNKLYPLPSVDWLMKPR